MFGNFLYLTVWYSFQSYDPIIMHIFVEKKSKAMKA